MDKELWKRLGSEMSFFMADNNKLQQLLQDEQICLRQNCPLSNEHLEQIWQHIKHNMTYTADLTIPYKNVGRELNTKKKDLSKEKPVIIQEHIKTVRKLIIKLKQNNLKRKHVPFYNSLIDNINDTYNLDCTLLTIECSLNHTNNMLARSSWISQSFFWLKSLRQILKNITNNIQRVKFQSIIENRFKHFRNSLKSVLDSILD